MNFAVEWFTPAEEELADLWVKSPDRAEITAAANAIDRLLA